MRNFILERDTIGFDVVMYQNGCRIGSVKSYMVEEEAREDCEALNEYAPQEEALPEFPYTEIRDAGGDLFPTYADALRAGFDASQIWAIMTGELGSFCWTYCAGPHFVDVLGYVATTERHTGGECFDDWSL